MSTKKQLFATALHFVQHFELVNTSHDKPLALKQHKHLIKRAIQSHHGPLAFGIIMAHLQWLMYMVHSSLYMSSPVKNVVF